MKAERWSCPKLPKRETKQTEIFEIKKATIEAPFVSNALKPKMKTPFSKSETELLVASGFLQREPTTICFTLDQRYPT